MANNLNQFSYPDDSLGLREIIKILLEYKKLLISTLLFFTISSIFYSLNLKPEFKSSIILEIGYSEIPDGTQTLIENPSNVISDLKVLIMKNPNNKFTPNVSVNSFEDKLIKLETTSSSVEQNENILNEMISYIDERHSNLEASINNQKKNLITKEIKKNEAEKAHYKSKLSNQTQSQYLEIIASLDKETQALERLDLLIKNSAYNDKIFILNQKLILLIEEIEMLDSKVKSKTHLIGNIETETIKPKTQLIISAGVLIGFFTGIFLVFIRNFVKSYKESQA